MELVTMREMLEAGFHFGHQTRRWNPKMKEFIFTEKNGIHIIDLQKSLAMAKIALNKVVECAQQGNEILIVGTKKQAQSIIHNLSEEGEVHYIDQRWIGGLLTNFELIRKSIEKLIELDEMKNDGRWDILAKKEQSKMEKLYKKLKKSLWGVRKLTKRPALLIVIDTNFEEIAVNEANKLGIPIVGIIDTNSNPTNIDFPIPGNDDAIRSIKLFVQKFIAAYKYGKENMILPEVPEEVDAEVAGKDSVEAEKEVVEVKNETKEKAEPEVVEAKKAEVKAEVKEEVKAEVKEEVKAEVKEEVKAEVKEEVKAEVKEETKTVESKDSEEKK